MSRLPAIVVLFAATLASSTLLADEAPGVPSEPAAPPEAPVDPSSTGDAAPSAAVPYPDEVRNEFMTSCVGSGGPEPVCACVLGQLERSWTVDQLANNEVDVDWLDATTNVCLEPFLADLLANQPPVE